jgi:hypothetical protein
MNGRRNISKISIIISITIFNLNYNFWFIAAQSHFLGFLQNAMKGNPEVQCKMESVFKKNH